RAHVGAGAVCRVRLGEGARLMAVAMGVEVVDLSATSLRELNQRLHDVAGDDPDPRLWRIVNPNGAHAVACGLDAPVEVEIAGHVGYHCAGMNQRGPGAGRRQPRTGG